MFKPFTHASFTVAARAMATAALIALTGCAQNYVVLLPDDDGAVGKVVVTTPTETTQLDQASQGTIIGGPRHDTFLLSQADLQKDFGAALMASPKKPVNYLLYFEAGQATLTEASQAEIPKIKDDVAQRAGADISIIGHTDTQGDAQANFDLGLTRAKQVSVLIGDTGLNADHVSIESHGEKNLLVKTPDNTDEPRNRAVEVIVR